MKSSKSKPPCLLLTHDGICDIHSVTIFHIFGGFDTWMPQDDDAQLELSRAEKS